ncbi:hypothetical protein D3C75_1127750 [compost metagenome]
MAGQENDRPADCREHARHGKTQKLARVGTQAQRQTRFEKGVTVEEHQQTHTDNQGKDHARAPLNF